MKIAQNLDLVESESEGLFETTEAGISNEDQGFMFDILSKRLYSNPQGTIIREITSNCFDSHVEAGVQKPVVIKFTYDEGTTFMSFMDFGVGLSPDRIKKVYMNYFSSTKRQTNTQIGGFGLGSKSPLSYTDSFFIITQFQGSRRTYLMAQAAQKPTLELLLEEDCPVDENGTEIKIPLKENGDIERFGQEIIDQLFYFDNVFVQDDRGKRLGYNLDVDALNKYQVHDFKTFKYRPQSNKKSKLHLVIDKVTYPIDFTQLKMNEIEIPVAVKFEIGELEVNPTRESILYNKVTVELITKRINEFFDELKTLYTAQNVKSDFKVYAKAIGSYFEKKNIFIDLNGTEHKISISLDKLAAVRIDGEYFFPPRRIKSIFPAPAFNVFTSAGYELHYNMFSHLDWYKCINSGKLEDIYSRNNTALDLLTQTSTRKAFIFDSTSDRIKNRFIQNANLLRAKSFIEFYKQYNKYAPANEWKTIDLSKGNKIDKIRRLHHLFIDEVAKMIDGYYSKCQLSQEFQDMLDQERIAKREEFKDKMKVETCSSGYMYEQKVTADWFKQFNIIVYSERQQEINDRDLVRAESIFKRRLNHSQNKNQRLSKHGNRFKPVTYTFITSAKRNIEAYIKFLPNAIHLKDFLKLTEKWDVDYQLVKYIKSCKPIAKILANEKSIAGLNNVMYQKVVAINNFTKRINHEENFPKSKVEVEKLFKNHSIYHELQAVIKYFDNLEMLKYIDTYSMEKDGFKKVFVNYLKLNNKKLDPAHYMKLNDFEVAMLAEVRERNLNVQTENLALINGRYNYPSIDQPTLIALI